MAKQREFTGRINDLATAFRQSAVLYAAVEADVFSHFTAGRKTADEVAEALQWNRRGARIFLDALVALELLDKRGDAYGNTALASACLVPEAPAYQGNIVRHLKAGYMNWFHLEDALRTGEAVRMEDDKNLQGERRSPDDLRNFILGMGDIARMSARQILDAVDLAGYRQLLDVGGGPGSYSIAFVNQHPELRATLFDRPDVVDIARAQVSAAGLDGRIEFIPGDFMADALGSGYDLVLLSNIIHSYGPENNQRLVKKCFEALEPGGLLILKDFIPDDDRSGPPFSLLFALHMLIHTGEGDTYPYAEVALWTDAAGFAPGREVAITPQSRLWLAEKPR
ncbi:MAG: methyltransferase [Candidatus Hydrogenedentales bacterium]|jgi:SAM-dependent methyltransferase